ncbi:FlgN protein [Peptoclostridium litorale DSM 5388]|uniref:FlgN family protein n=1 Tax=Peptoclostridium litorale DSM 5388 TaxID=1121324 RepID=A0A069RCJ3_PEPLI|nr:flagellar export chaperone FlgN [Peptoclostridium litorale]KDR94774.1 hypothetical protein CLIT_13c00960 [Peptoclostridium litorale DSM 5388]SIN92401.1 FlgN protein [Peptoclostridium litorale DSM 5388]
MDSKKTIASIVELLAQKRALMRSVYDITKEQNGQMKRENIDVFLANLKKRQLLMDEIDVIDAKFYRYFVQMKKLMGVDSLDDVDTLKHPELKSLKDGVREILELVREIKSIDEQSSSMANESMARLKEDMKALQQRKQMGNKISSGYASTYRHAQGVFIDNKK